MHGAAHQAPQVFQLMVDRHVADRDIERVRLRFYTNEYLGIKIEMNIADSRGRAAFPKWLIARLAQTLSCPRLL